MIFLAAVCSYGEDSRVVAVCASADDAAIALLRWAEVDQALDIPQGLYRALLEQAGEVCAWVEQEGSSLEGATLADGMVVSHGIRTEGWWMAVLPFSVRVETIDPTQFLAPDPRYGELSEVCDSCGVAYSLLGHPATGRPLVALSEAQHAATCAATVDSL